MSEFDGKVALITGGAIGLGRALARALTATGTAVSLVDIDGEGVTRTAKELESGGARALALDCNVADERQVDAAVARTVNELGGIDILINNAALHLTKYNLPFSELARAEVRSMFEVNVMGIVNFCVACRETMRARGGGAIVNVSSIGGLSSTSPYGVSKLAVRGLTIAFATELSPDGTRVNAIAPGLMASENAVADLPPALYEEFADQRQLVKRKGTMDDMANAILFLCSNSASFITGQTLAVNGGYPLQI